MSDEDFILIFPKFLQKLKIIDNYFFKIVTNTVIFIFLVLFVFAEELEMTAKFR